uniref:UPAR/Ly6 domain-containing protein n=1 Tax=Caenorhabditis japonica TaxID=281687 RepID=A0A8R1DWN7_CAEJA
MQRSVYFTLFLPLLTLQVGRIMGQNSRNCFACASSDLKNKWYLTGLAPVPDSYFTSNCGNRGNQMARESCPGPCFTMVFDNPDDVGPTQQTPATYVVRGCHRTLTNVVTDRGDNNTNNGDNTQRRNFCEIDTTYKMADRRGNLVNVRMMSMLCGDVDSCNDQEFATDFMTGVTCANQTNDNLLNNSPLNCYECTPSEGKNCHESKCSKKYCSKQQVKLDGGFQLMKTCTNVNIFGVDTMCQTYDVFTNPGGVPVKSQYTQCYCKDKQFCNSAVGASLAVCLMFMAFFSVLFF